MNSDLLLRAFPPWVGLCGLKFTSPKIATAVGCGRVSCGLSTVVTSAPAATRKMEVRRVIEFPILIVGYRYGRF